MITWLHFIGGHGIGVQFNSDLGQLIHQRKKLHQCYKMQLIVDGQWQMKRFIVTFQLDVEKVRNSELT